MIPSTSITFAEVRINIGRLEEFVGLPPCDSENLGLDYSNPAGLP